ncbi:hypothetical protein AFNJKBDN_CDS0018 [Halorubrum virus V_ICIS4]|nr:hypothetical protein AFNJKBDN_CDS0018 [Halorubrum virus V_ICIS4]
MSQSNDHPDTRTVTTPIGDALRRTLARAAGLDPDSVRVVDADLRDGALAVEIEGERV